MGKILVRNGDSLIFQCLKFEIILEKEQPFTFNFCNTTPTHYSLQAAFVFNYYIVAIPANIANNVAEYGGLLDRSETILFTLAVLFWSSLFNILWKNQESKFSIIYGQTDQLEEETEIIGFHGIPKRNISNDKLNDLH